MSSWDSTWTQRLLTFLPREAADVVTQLSKENSESYEKVKSSLLRKYRLTAGAFRQRFRSVQKRKDQGYPEFVYELRDHLMEWLKSADAFGEHTRTLECFCARAVFSLRAGLGQVLATGYIGRYQPCGKGRRACGRLSVGQKYAERVSFPERARECESSHQAKALVREK